MAWSKYKEVQYGTVFPGSNLTDFPLLVKIAADSDIASECGSGGGIKFTSADGLTDLAFGLYPSSDITTGDIIARVKASPITSGTTGNPIVRLYYSASESTSENKAGVMDGNYVLFMPLEEDPSGSAPQMFDWVSETNVGTSSGTMTSGDLIDGQVGKGLDFDGSDDNITVPSSILTGTGNTFTLECAVYGTSFPAYTTIFDTTGRHCSLWASATAAAWYYGVGGITDGLSSSSTLATSQWNALALVSNGTNASVYHNGAVRDSGRSIGSNCSQAINFGTNPSTGGALLVGKRDEIRMSSNARSADWLAYAYENDFNNSDTVTLGSEQGGGGGGAANVNLLRGKVRGGLLLGGKL